MTLATNLLNTTTMASRSTSVLTIAGITVVGGILAYAVYFDYKRRNDVEFRKKLSKWLAFFSHSARSDQYTQGRTRNASTRHWLSRRNLYFLFPGRLQSLRLTSRGLWHKLSRNKLQRHQIRRRHISWNKSARVKDYLFKVRLFSTSYIASHLMLIGPEFHLLSAMCFYRALRVYPSPVELIVIYQKTVPEVIFKVC